MLVDATLRAHGLKDVAAAACRLEAQGYGGIWVTETQHDPFLPLVLVGEHTEQVTLGTSIAVAFARNPMNLAYLAHDLQRFAEGRFVLGLGSQVRAHIERRFSMPWSRPAARMRELVLALRHIWRAWDDGEALDFQGEFYRHSLMTPFFAPPASPHGLPPVHLAAVGAAMTKVAGEVADGLIVHSFTTADYLRQQALPALAEGAAAGGRDPAEVVVRLSGFTVTASDEASLAAAIEATRRQIAFYGSTPAYRPVLALHGWGETADRLHELSRSADPGRWEAMGRLVDDDMLEAFAVVGAPGEIAARVVDRFGGIVDRYSFYTPYPSDPEMWAGIAREIVALTAGR